MEIVLCVLEITLNLLFLSHFSHLFTLISGVKNSEISMKISTIFTILTSLPNTQRMHQTLMDNKLKTTLILIKLLDS
jgi:hypothetical protein